MDAPRSQNPTDLRPGLDLCKILFDMECPPSSFLVGSDAVSEVFVEGTYEYEYEYLVRGRVRAVSIDLPCQMHSQTPPALSSHVPCHPFELSNLHSHEIVMKLELGSQAFLIIGLP